MKLTGFFYGEKIEITCEKPICCDTLQLKLSDTLDIVNKEGCPENCEFVIRYPDAEEPFFTCDIQLDEEV